MDEIVNMENEKREKIKTIFIYKDFDIYNGLIDTFLILSNKIDSLIFNLKVCVFNYKGSTYGELFKQNGGKLDNLGLSRKIRPLVIWYLFRYLKKEKPQIVQTFVLKPNLCGVIAAKLAKVPVIISTELTLKDQAPTPIKRIRDIFLYSFNQYLMKFVDSVVCNSNAVKKQYQGKFNVSKIKVIYSPFNMLKPNNVTKIADKKKEFVIGTIGRLSEEKRHIDLFKAISIVRKDFHNISLLIVGDGYYRRHLEETSKKMGLTDIVDFAGFQMDIYKYLKKMDIFVLPSRTEALGKVLLEAMWADVPVIASKVGGIPEIIINNESGILINPGNPKEIANAILELLADPAKRKRLRENGRERLIKIFNPEKFIRELENLYISLLKAKRII